MLPQTEELAQMTQSGRPMYSHIVHKLDKLAKRRLLIQTAAWVEQRLPQSEACPAAYFQGPLSRCVAAQKILGCRMTMQGSRSHMAEMLGDNNQEVTVQLHSRQQQDAREGRTNLVEEWLLTYKVQVPDSASRVSTPNEHRICSKVHRSACLILS